MALTHYRNRGVKDMMLRASTGRTSHQFMSGDEPLLSVKVLSEATAHDESVEQDEDNIDID